MSEKHYVAYKAAIAREDCRPFYVGHFCPKLLEAVCAAHVSDKYTRIIVEEWENGKLTRILGESDHPTTPHDEGTENV
jgi:hypothetical protein